MSYIVNDRYCDGLVHLIAYNFTRTGLSKISFHNNSSLFRQASAFCVITVWMRAMFLRTSFILDVLSSWFVAF